MKNLLIALLLCATIGMIDGCAKKTSSSSGSGETPKEQVTKKITFYPLKFDSLVAWGWNTDFLLKIQFFNSEGHSITATNISKSMDVVDGVVSVDNKKQDHIIHYPWHVEGVAMKISPDKKSIWIQWHNGQNGKNSPQLYYKKKDADGFYYLSQTPMSKDTIEYNGIKFIPSSWTPKLLYTMTETTVNLLDDFTVSGVPINGVK